MPPRPPGSSASPGWDAYLAAFHHDRPGITDAVLSRAVDRDGRDPYDWVAEALPGAGVVVDVACGSGPLADRLAGAGPSCGGGGPAGATAWIGLDRNAAELRLAARAAPGRLVLAEATAAPVRAGGAGAVVCSMALMLVDDPGAALAEMVRLLRPGGRIVVLVPGTAPLTARDQVRYVRLLAALRRRRMPFRHPRVLDDGASLLAAAGLVIEADESRRFAYPVPDAGAARQWLRSLYLPGIRPGRRRAAERITERWIGSDIGIPLRRVVAAPP